MSRLFLLFFVVPAVELAILIELGSAIGTLPTLGIVFGTAIVGAYLARRQGLTVIERMRADVRSGYLPAEPVFDGVLILLAGALLVTPGLLTDLVGLALLVPFVRRWTKIYVKRAVEKAVVKAVQEGRVRTQWQGPRREPPIKDVDAVVEDDEGQ